MKIYSHENDITGSLQVFSSFGPEWLFDADGLSFEQRKQITAAIRKAETLARMSAWRDIRDVSQNELTVLGGSLAPTSEK